MQRRECANNALDVSDVRADYTSLAHCCTRGSLCSYLARLGIGKTHRRPVAQFAQFALNAATLTCPEKVADLKSRLAAEDMPDIVRAVLNNSALADVHAIAVGE